jgi:hypothetical protein
MCKMVEVDYLDTATPLTSFLVAMLIGVTHVVLGPDHVSALLLLVAGVKRREHLNENSNKLSVWKNCALQGFRWGIGHTIGLSFMTSIFMIFRDEIPMDKIGTASDYIVGSMMIFIGAAAMFSLYNWMKQEKKRLKHINQPNDEEYCRDHPKDGLPLPVKSDSGAHTEAHDHHLTHLHSNEVDAVDENETLWQKFTKWRMGDTFTDTPTSAYVVGGFHGVSGLSGIVYVLPALFLDDNLRLFLYMLGFFMTSIASMTVVGGTIGLIPSSTKKLMFLNGFAGTAVLGVGITWIVLTSMDKLDL